jgi:hypothetical protein
MRIRPPWRLMNMEAAMKAIIAILVLSCWSAIGKQTLSSTHAERIADAIYVIEGGDKASTPYGILSVKVENENHARKICLTTIHNTHSRWIKSGAKGNFLNFLADRYCPPTDSVGNSNWKKNIHRVLYKNTPTSSRAKPKGKK